MISQERAINTNLATAFIAACLALSTNVSHADDLFDAFNEILSPVQPEPIASAPPVEAPVVRAAEDVDPVDQLVGPRYSRAHRILLNAQLALTLPESDERRTDSIRELRELVRSEPDRFIWTNRNRWTSTRRLARQTLQTLNDQQADPTKQNVAISELSFSDIARLALRSDQRSTSDRLLQSWASVRRDAGGFLLPDLRLEETADFRAPVLEQQKNDQPAAPVSLARWTRDSGSPRWNQLVDKIRVQRRADRQSLIPAFEPAVSDQLIIWRTARGLQAVERESGNAVWNVALPDSFVAARADDGPRRSTLPFQLQGWRRGVPADDAAEHELFAGGGRSRPVADDQRAYVVIDPMARSPRINVRRFNFQNRNSPSEASSLSCNILRAINLKTGRTRWEIGGESLQDSFDRPLAGTFFLGPPAVVGQSLYVLAEQSGEITLLVLSADTGSLQWSQPLAATRTPIDQSPNRRFWSLSPVLKNGIAVCPSGIGWTFAVDVDGRELLWAQRVVGPERRTNRYNFSQLSEVDQRWRSQPLVIRDQTVWTFPPESGGEDGVSSPQRGYCLDLLSGEPLFVVPRSKAILPIAVYTQDDESAAVLFAEQDAVLMTKADRAGTSSREIWRREIGPGRLISGRPLLVGDEIHVPVDASELWTLSAADGRIVKRRPYDQPGRLANLTLVDSRLLSCGPTSLIQLQSAASISDESATSIATSPSQIEQLSIARVTGNITKAIACLEEWSRSTTNESSPDRFTAAERSQFFALATATLTTAIDEGLPASPQVLSAIEQLASSPNERAQIERYRILAFIQNNRLVDAASQLMELAAANDLEDVTVSCADSVGTERLPQRLVRLDRWLTASLGELWPKLTEDDQRQLHEELSRQHSGTYSDELLVRLAPIATTFDDFRQSIAPEDATFDEGRTPSRIVASLTADTALDHERAALANFFAGLAWTDDVTPCPAWTTALQINTTGVGQGPSKLTSIPIITSDVLSTPTNETVAADTKSTSPLSNVQLVLNPSLKAALVRSLGTGTLLATLPLTDRPREVHDSRPHAWHDRDQLLIAHQGNLYVFRLADWSLAWSHPLPPSTPFHQIGTDASFQFDRPRTLPDQRQPRETSVVAIGPDVIVIRNQASLTALDRTDGTTCWTRDALADERIIGHLRSGLIVRSGSKWRSIRFLDGATRSIDLPSPPRSATATFDNIIVTTEPDGYSGPVTLTGWHVVDEGSTQATRKIWQHELPNDAAVGLLPPRVVAIIDESDTLELLDLATGDRNATGNIPGLTARSNLRFYGVVDHHRLFIASFDDRTGDPFDAIGGQSIRVRGTLAAIDLPTASVAWTRESQIGNFLWGYSRRTPVVLLCRRKRTLVDTIPITEFQFTALSTQTGATIAEDQRKLTDNHVSSVNFDPQEQVISVRLMNSRLRLMPK